MFIRLLGMMFCFFLSAHLATAQNLAGIDAIHGKMRNSLVFIKAEGFNELGISIASEGTGFIINDQGYVLTAHHLIGSLKGIVPDSLKIQGTVSGKFGYPVELRILHESNQRDVLVLSFPDSGATFEPACLDFDQDPPLGTQIATSGFPGAIDYTSDQGLLKGKKGPPQRPGLWRTEMPFNSGQSGSPIYLDDGHVIGFASGAITNTSGLHYFQPLRELKSEVSEFASCNSSTPNKELIMSSAVKQCVAEQLEHRLVKSFSVEGSARCPGGGCFAQSPSCNDRAVEVRYEAPAGYSLEDVSYSSISENYAQNSSINLYRPAENRVTVASISLICSPPDQPGAAGGWSNGVLQGIARHMDPNALREQIITECSVNLSNQ